MLRADFTVKPAVSKRNRERRFLLTYGCSASQIITYVRSFGCCRCWIRVASGKRVPWFKAKEEHLQQT
ncbi:hypothetical protein R1flu_007399 [Riccia fluitans]|uniref:Ribosomal protein S14 n=1 Tax=Riccia fluitans TaxID=41844 RepID=A0ABD1YZK4_9MARC